MVSRTLTVFNPPSESQTYSAKRVHESSPRQIRKRARHAPSASVTTDTCNSSSTTTDHGTDELPDEVLVHIFHFIRDASRLARLRQVCRQWRDVIDDTSSVWRLVSFKNAQFSRFVTVRAGSLELGRRVGRKAVSIAARAGNEWASFVKLALFDGHCLRAVTKGQPIASRLVGGDLSVLKSSFPPWPLGARAELGPLGRWVGVHAARSDMCDPDLPKGAVVGIVHVRHAVRVANDAWVWTIDRAVQLKRPIRCAGFVGLWSFSPFLTDLLVHAMHTQ